MYVFNYGKQQWPIRSSDPGTRVLLFQREQILQKRNYRRGLLIDFDYAKFLDADPVVSEGVRTVCILVFSMARRSHRHLGHNPVHGP